MLVFISVCRIFGISVKNAFGFDPRLALLLFVAEALILQGFRSFYVVADLHPPAPSRFIASAIMLFLINSVFPLL